MAIPNWLTLSRDSGNSGTTIVVVTADTNTTFSERTYALTVSNDNTGLSRIVNIIQSASGGDDYSKDYLTFEILSGGTIKLGKNAAYLYYSKNGGDWTQINEGGTLNVNTGDEIEWKGDGTAGSTPATDDMVSFFNNGTAVFNVYGNIASLMEMDNFYDVVGTDCTKLYNFVFVKTKVVDASDLILPFTGFSEDYTSSYGGMFEGCSKLTKAPKLPATVLKLSCYHSMFSGCTSLEEAPELPATTLANSCYAFMFQNCTSLTKAPELPATTLANYCYQLMFQGCSNLKSVELPATMLTTECYYEMFSGCTNLNYIKCLATNISATNCTKYWVGNVANFGYFIKPSSMNDWTIDSADGIPVGWTVINGGLISANTSTVNFNFSASGSNIDIISSSSWQIVNNNNWISVSETSGNSGINTIQINVSENTGIAERTGTLTVRNTENNSFTITIVQNFADYQNMYLTFKMLSAGTVSQWNVKGYHNVYFRKNGEEWIQCTTAETLSVQAGDEIEWKGGATQWIELKSTGEYKVYGNIMSIMYGDNFNNQTDFSGRNSGQSVQFSGGTTLIDASHLILPATGLTSKCYSYMFYNCSALQTAPVLPATSLATDCYQYMFAKCTSLTNAPVLPATTVEGQCYKDMFAGCTSLTSAPVLPATELKYNCYQEMFSGCTNLNYIKCLATDISAYDCTTDWVDGVAASGTFVKASGVTWPTGTNGIPSGWSVQEN